MTLIGRCHCARNAFEIAGELPEKLTRCTCSFCSKRGHLYAYYTPDQLRVTQADSDAVYRWNSKTVANHFAAHAAVICMLTVRIFSPTEVGTARW